MLATSGPKSDNVPYMTTNTNAQLGKSLAILGGAEYDVSVAPRRCTGLGDER